MNELTISKGAHSLTLYATTIAENYTNKIFVITPASSSGNQASGPSPVRIVDLLRVTHQLVIKCYITGSATKTAKEVKDDLVSIFEGGEIAGGTTTLVYDGDSLEGYLEKVNFVENASDNQPETDKEFARYEVAITFIVGVQV